MIKVSGLVGPSFKILVNGASNPLSPFVIDSTSSKINALPIDFPFK